MSGKSEALENAGRRLRDSVDRLLAQGVPLEDIRELADAARVYGAEHALAKLTTARMSPTSPSYRSGAATVSHVKSVLLPLTDDH